MQRYRIGDFTFDARDTASAVQLALLKADELVAAGLSGPALELSQAALALHGLHSRAYACPPRERSRFR